MTASAEIMETEKGRTGKLRCFQSEFESATVKL